MTNDPDSVLHSISLAKSRSDRRAREATIPRLPLREFAQLAWPLVEGAREFRWSWHLDALCLHLEALVDGTLGKRKLCVNIPPRTSKSTIVTVMFPCWLWTIQAWAQIIFASYSFGLSRDHAYKRRSIIESAWYRERFPRVELLGDRNNFAEVGNTLRGLMVTTSVTGTVTGKGGDYRILDDPNDAEAMESETVRASTLRWIDVNWSTRANDLSTVRDVLIQQRTHTEDVTGHYLATEAADWCHLKLPMEFEPSRRCATPIWTDPRSAKGEILDAVRFPAEHLARQRVRLGPYFYAGQYDQEPYPIGGGIFKQSWFGRWQASGSQPGHITAGLYTFDPAKAFRFAVVDPAVSEQTMGEKKTGDPDYTAIYACAAFATPQGALLAVLDVVRERMAGPDIVPRLHAMHRHWRFAVIGIETVAFQLSLFQQARREGLPVREISTKADDEAIYRIDRDKIARAMGATPMVASGRVFVPEYAPWLGDFFAEVCAFPNAAHDDLVDTLAYACAIAEKCQTRGGTATDTALPARGILASDSSRHSTPDAPPAHPLDGFQVARPW